MTGGMPVSTASSKCRKNGLLNSIKSKEKFLAKLLERSDPREDSPAIKADIQELHAKMADKVWLIGVIYHTLGKKAIGRACRILHLAPRSKSHYKTCQQICHMRLLDLIKLTSMSKTFNGHKSIVSAERKSCNLCM